MWRGRGPFRVYPNIKEKMYLTFVNYIPDFNFHYIVSG